MPLTCKCIIISIKEMMNELSKKGLIPALLIFALLTSLACKPQGQPGGGGPAVDGNLKVVATIFPLYDWAKQIGGDKVDVSLLLPPGIEAHGFSPTPKDILRIREADVFLWTGPAMEPWVHDILQGLDDDHPLVVNTTHGILPDDEKHDHLPGETCEHDHGVDPHVWLDPLQAQQMVGSIVAALSETDKANSALYSANGEEYAKKLEELHEDISAILPFCTHSTIICGGHFAFGHFAERYGLAHASPYKGFSPDAVPTPKAVADLVKMMKETGRTTIFYEELIDPKVARVIAEETGAKLLLLHGAHNVSAEELESGLTYLEIMRGNLDRLKEGLGYE